MSNLVAAVGVKPFVLERGAWKKGQSWCCSAYDVFVGQGMSLVYRIKRALVRLRLGGGFNSCYAGQAFSRSAFPKPVTQVRNSYLHAEDYAGITGYGAIDSYSCKIYIRFSKAVLVRA